MATIAEATPGTLIYIDETVSGVLSHVPYIYLGMDSSGNCICLRQKAEAYKRMHSEDVAVYSGCEMDLYLEDDETGFLARFDEATRFALQTTTIKSYLIESETTVELARKCFLLSYSELGYATTPDEGTSYLDALKTAADTTANSTARITYAEDGTAANWWMRSPSSASQFRIVSADGGAFYNVASVAWYRLRPALSVAPATIISELDSEIIYLLPDPDKLYREVGATVTVGTSARRPNHARVSVETANYDTLEMYVSNNAGDAEPAWVAVENNGIVELPNTTKETDEWVIGVKFYATSNTRAVIGEPIVITLEDQE